MRRQAVDTTEISAVVSMYVRGRLNRQRPISTAEAIRAIRTALPGCTLNDRQLAQMVARAAISYRHPVILDEGSR
jgi:hypothetical protein